MQRIYIFLAEVTTTLSIFELTASTKNELFNIGMIIFIRIGFHFFEKKFPSVKDRIKSRFKKPEA